MSGNADLLRHHDLRSSRSDLRQPADMPEPADLCWCADMHGQRAHVHRHTDLRWQRQLPWHGDLRPHGEHVLWRSDMPECSHVPDHLQYDSDLYWHRDLLVGEYLPGHTDLRYRCDLHSGDLSGE